MQVIKPFCTFYQEKIWHHFYFQYHYFKIETFEVRGCSLTPRLGEVLVGREEETVYCLQYSRANRWQNVSIFSVYRQRITFCIFFYFLEN